MKRYVAARIRDAKTEEGLTEENFKVTIHYCLVIQDSLLVFSALKSLL